MLELPEGFAERYPTSAGLSYKVPRGRVGGNVTRQGVIVDHRQTAKGPFVLVRDVADNEIRSVRPANVVVAA